MKLTKKLMCISMRNGVEIWLEEERTHNLKQILRQLNGSKFIDLGDEMINSADITGIYDAKTMADLVRRKNGEHICKHGTWHKRGDVCDCRPIPEDQSPERLNLSNDQEKNIEKIKEMTRILIEDNKSKSIKINPAYQKGSNKS